MPINVVLRDVTEDDVPIFFKQQNDPAASHLVAFTSDGHGDRDAFFAKWAKIMSNDATVKQTIVVDGSVAGNVLRFEMGGQPAVGYWIAREFWGKGIATKAIAMFLAQVTERPLYARTAWDNAGSIRVLEKNGFKIVGRERAFANARGEEIDELIHILDTTATIESTADFADADRAEIAALSRAVYPPEETADWPGHNIEWSTPAWCERMRDTSNALVSYVGIYVRDAEHDGRAIRVGGIGNVKTHPTARGRGLASAGIRRAIEFLRDEHAVEFALLVCEPHLLAYYATLGWREFAGKLLVRQHGDAAEFTLCRVMTLGLAAAAPVAGIIDLRGPPW